MTLINISKLSPKRLFRSKRDRSMVSRSDLSSFSSGTTPSSSFSTQHKPRSTNVGASTSVLPEISGDWSDIYVELVQAFNIMDRKNDRIVSRRELEAMLSRLGAQSPSLEEVATLMNRIGSACEPTCDAELREAFGFFDTDHDGRITAEELQQGVFVAIADDRCTLDDCRRMIAGVDKKGDGFVCFDDFCRMMELRA